MEIQQKIDLTFKSKVDRYMDGKGMEGYGLSAGRWD